MVADATLKDETGKITLTLWNEQVRQVMVGDKVKIENMVTLNLSEMCYSFPPENMEK